MKTGMNLLLWTTHVTEEHFPLFEKLKNTGFEVGYQQPIMGNFGVNANYTYADGKVDAGGEMSGN